MSYTLLSTTLVCAVTLVCVCSGSWTSQQQLLIHREVAKLGLTADVTATIEESLFQKISATVVPLINQYAQGLVIPGQSGSHFSFDNVVIQEFNIGGLAITMAAPSTLTVSLTDLSFSVPQTDFDVWEKIIFKITCHGSFWASMSGTSITLTLSITESAGKLDFTNAQSSVAWGTLNIGHKFSTLICKVGQDIVQVFIGNVNNLIKNLVEKDLPEKIGPMLENALNKAVAKLPLDIVSQPLVTSESISVTVDLLFGDGAARGLLKRPLHTARSRALAPRDLELQIPQSAVDNLLIYAQQRGLLNRNVTEAKFNTSEIRTLFPTVYAECPDCPFAIEVNCESAPLVTMGNESITVALVNSIMGLNVRAPNGTIIPFVDLWLNATLSVNQLSILTNNSVYFQIGVVNLGFGLRYSAIGPFDASLINTVVNIAVDDIVVPDFNTKFHGIPLPAVLTSGELQIVDSTAYVAFDVQL